MKYLLVLLLLIFNCVAVNNSASASYNILYVDGCQYIVTEQGGIAHKANCSNSDHK